MQNKGTEVVVVVNPIKVDLDEVRGLLETAAAEAGWAAYAISGGKHLTDDPFALELQVDGQASSSSQTRTLVVGNCGELTGGMVLMPDAVVDDGLLDVATVSPESLTQWIGVAARVLGNRGDGPSLQREQGRDLLVRVDPPQLCEVDGDVLSVAGRLRFVVQPAALVAPDGS